MKTTNLTPYECYHNFPIGTKFKILNARIDRVWPCNVGDFFITKEEGESKLFAIRPGGPKYSCYDIDWDKDLFELCKTKKKVFK